MKSRLLATTLLSALITTAASAETTREADAHQHGHGVLNVALEGKTLNIELETPGADILGFEHAAESADDKETVQKARETLSDPAALFGLPAAAKCSITEAEIEIGADETDHDDEHDEEKHDDEHGHDEEHAEDKHDDAHGHEEEHAEAGHDDAHEHDEDHADEDNHSEVHAHYTLTCTAPAKLTGLNLSGYFDAFPNAEELDAAILSDEGQASGEVTPTSATLNF